jgi:hypothetical protein
VKRGKLVEGKGHSGGFVHSGALPPQWPVPDDTGYFPALAEEDSPPQTIFRAYCIREQRPHVPSSVNHSSVDD